MTLDKALRRVPIVTIGVLALLVLLAWFFSRRQPTTFDVTAHTEWVEFSPSGGSQTAWSLTDVTWFRADGSEAIFTGTFEPTDGSRVRIERIARGPVVIEVEPPPSAVEPVSTGRLDPQAGSGRIDGGDYTGFVIGSLAERADSGTSVLVPIAGHVHRVGHRVGRSPTGSSAILRSGKVRMIGRALLGDQVFEAGSVDLEPGDIFEVRDTTVQALGFIVADDAPGLLAAYRTTGTVGWVQRPGGGDQEVSISLLTRIVHEPLFRVVAMIGGWLVAFATVGAFAFDAREARSK